MINLPEKSRVCFVGDSITANNGYILYIQDYFYKNRSADGIKFYNCGASGGSTVSQLIYFDDDTARHNPTHIFIMLGVNDSWRDRLAEPKSKERYAILKEKYEQYKINLEKLYDKAKENGATVIFMTPPPYAEYQSGDAPVLPGAYSLIQGYADYVKCFAAAKGCELIDIHAYLTERMQTEDLYNPDRVHPTDKGHYYMAKCILENFGFEMGEYAPIPSYLDTLKSKIQALRYIYFTELNVIGNYHLSLEEKYQKVKAYLEAPSPRFEIQAQGFLDNREHMEQLYRDIEDILQKGFD